MIFNATLGDIVQQQRNVEQLAVVGLYGVEQLAGKAQVGCGVPFDFVEHADAAQQMLVHRIMVIHVELHHRHDPAEGTDKCAKHASLVHAAQHGLGFVFRRQDFKEQPVGFLVAAQLGVDQLKRAGGRAHRFGMNGEIVLLREVEQPDEIDRIALEDVRTGEIDAIVVDKEVGALAQLPPAGARRAKPRNHPAQHRSRLRLPVLEIRAHNGGQIADMLGGQEIVLHEALDIAQAGMLGVAKPHRDLTLDIE